MFTRKICQSFLYIAILTSISLLALSADVVKSASNDGENLPAVQSGEFKQPADIAAESAKQLQLTPDDLELRLKYADALFEMNKVDAALVEYTKVRDADKKNSDALLGIACCNENIGYSGIALSGFRSSCNANPANAAAVNGYLSCAFKQGRLSEAIPYLRGLSQRNKHAAAGCYWTMASWYVNSDYWKAQTYSKEANRLDPKCFPSSTINAATLVYESGDAMLISTPGSSRQQRMGTGGSGSGMRSSGSSSASANIGGGSRIGGSSRSGGGGSSSGSSMGGSSRGGGSASSGGGSTCPPSGGGSSGGSSG